MTATHYFATAPSEYRQGDCFDCVILGPYLAPGAFAGEVRVRVVDPDHPWNGDVLVVWKHRLGVIS